MAFALARGGASSDRGEGAFPGHGGDATAHARATSRGGNDAIAGDAAASDSGAFGGAGGIGTFSLDGSADGGDAISLSEALAQGNGGAAAYDRALGGTGGTNSERAGDGGDAVSTATARGVGSGRVTARADARGGDGGSAFTFFDSPRTPGAGGAAVASASGFSEGGGDVEVSAIQTAGAAGLQGSAAGASPIDGRDSVVLDAVRGSTSGKLSLTQIAVAGAGSDAGAGGDARSELTNGNEGGGELAQIAEARGGSGYTGGDAHASASRQTDGTAVLSIRATAVGGAGGRFGQTGPAGGGGIASLGVVSGASTGGDDVEVIGEITGGAGGNRFSGSGSGGDGAAATLENVVDGSTTGALTLVQRATGGAAGQASGSGFTAGQAGSATSRLAKETDSRALTLIAEAFGGAAATSSPTGGGVADARADAVNHSGSAFAAARAVGGTQAASAPGGAAIVAAQVTTHGDGHTVQVGRSYAADPRLSEFGAFGGTPPPSSPFPPVSGGGGDANSDSTGTALGDSEVRVYDLAVAGSTAGHSASHAVGTSAGSSSVEVSSLAISGNTSTAHAVGRGLGTVLVSARGDGAGSRGLADARAEAEGSSGAASSEAFSSSFRFTTTRAIAEAPVASAAVAESHAASTIALPGAGFAAGVDAYAAVTGSGERQDIWGRAALGLNDRQGLDGDDLTLRSEVSFERASPLNVGTQGFLSVSFLAVEAGSVDFEALTFDVRNGQTQLAHQVFTDVASALAFFSNPLRLAVGTGFVPIDLHFVLELESGGAGSGFAAVFALGTAVIPEPSTGGLVVVGLAILSARRTRRARP
jgi:hypothetical protein